MSTFATQGGHNNNGNDDSGDKDCDDVLLVVIRYFTTRSHKTFTLGACCYKRCPMLSGLLGGLQPYNTETEAA